MLIRRDTHKYNKNNRQKWQEFSISVRDPKNNTNSIVPHKREVKYLGVIIDDLLRLNKHLETQLEKARRAFWANSELFHNRHLSARAKIICYSLLVRPIISTQRRYGLTKAPHWWKSSVNSKERVSENACKYTAPRDQIQAFHKQCITI